MVFLTNLLGYAQKVKPLPRKFLRSGFVDLLKLQVKAGTGGFGLPRYGGTGGQGGNVYLRAMEKLSLKVLSSQLKHKKLNAGKGNDSTHKGIIGRPGFDITIDVPTGVSVYTKDGIFKGDLNTSNSTLLVAKGGLGGCAANGFCGQKGEFFTIILDLKLIADVALVGFPNAGKSTLLKTVSKATPKIASYPFTTVKPHLGIMEYKDFRSIKMADLPGLIEGAHENIGMGHKFLKHLERCKLMLFIVDIQGFQLSPRHSQRNCLDTVVLLNKEIELYKPDLLEMPAMLLINKMDTDKADKIYQEIKPKLQNLEEYIPHCPELIRPEKVLKFEKIVTTSLINSGNEEIQNIKYNIRHVLDEAERKQQQNDENLPLKLVERIKQSTKQQVPTLV